MGWVLIGNNKRAQNYKAPTKEDKILWISKAWEKISDQTIPNGFKACLEEEIKDTKKNYPMKKKF